MRASAPIVLLCVGALSASMSAEAQPAAIRIVAAENVYGAAAEAVAGPGVPVASILSNPNQDPHLFEATPSTVRAISEASIVVYNGAGYDPWMPRLLRAAARRGRQIIVVETLLHRHEGDNPHLWYDPAALPAAAEAVADALAEADPVNAAAYRERAHTFEATLAPLRDKIAAMRARFAGTPVTATEPVFGPMATALGLVVRNERFQLANMNGTEPRASDVAAFEADLRGRRVRVLLYNSQATGTAAQRMLRLAEASGVPAVGVTETQPAGTSYAAWMLSQLDALEAALSRASS